MKRSDVIDNARIQSGDVIVGLSSSGQATYESEYNGGMGSNGLTSARHDVFAHDLAYLYPESYDTELPEEIIYVGKRQLTEKVPGFGIDYGKLVLSPTRTYAPIIVKILEQMRPMIHGMIHCTGGAQTKVMHFVDNMRVIKDNLFEIPPLFRTIMEEGQTAPRELYKVFNMGHRMELYVPHEIAQDIIDISEDFGVDAQIVGHVEAADRNELILDTPLGHFTY